MDDLDNRLRTTKGIKRFFWFVGVLYLSVFIYEIFFNSYTYG